MSSANFIPNIWNIYILETLKNVNKVLIKKLDLKTRKW